MTDATTPPRTASRFARAKSEAEMPFRVEIKRLSDEMNRAPHPP